MKFQNAHAVRQVYCRVSCRLCSTAQLGFQDKDGIKFVVQKFIFDKLCYYFARQGINFVEIYENFMNAPAFYEAVLQLYIKVPQISLFSK